MRLLSEWAQKLEKMRRDETHVFQFNFVFSKILSALKQITTHEYICIYIYKCNAKNACRWILPSLFPWNDWTHGVRANNAVKISLQHFAVVNTSVIPTPHLSSSSPHLRFFCSYLCRFGLGWMSGLEQECLLVCLSTLDLDLVWLNMEGGCAVWLWASSFVFHRLPSGCHGWHSTDDRRDG